MLVNKKIEAHTNTTNRHKRDTSVGSRQIFDEASFFWESWNNTGDRWKHIIFCSTRSLHSALSLSYLSLAGRPQKCSKHNDDPQQEMGLKPPRNPRLHWTSNANIGLRITRPIQSPWFFLFFKNIAAMIKANALLVGIWVCRRERELRTWRLLEELKDRWSPGECQMEVPSL